MRVYLLSFLCFSLIISISLSKAGESVNPTGPIFKVLRENEWKDFNANGAFHGSPDDLRDGFIHLSPINQVERVIKKYFSKDRPIYIVKFSKPEFLEKLIWEVIPSGDIYPHLYHQPLLLSEVDNYEIRTEF
jgi:uncharacterized protein (DUF952 family)